MALTILEFSMAWEFLEQQEVSVTWEFPRLQLSPSFSGKREFLGSFPPMVCHQTFLNHTYRHSGITKRAVPVDLPRRAKRDGALALQGATEGVGGAFGSQGRGHPGDQIMQVPCRKIQQQNPQEGRVLRDIKAIIK